MNYTTGKFFLDTSFLIYCFSGGEKSKRARCQEILEEGKEKALFVLSTQVVKEFTAVMVGKYGADPSIVRQIIGDFSDFEVVQVDVPLIQKGLDIHLIHKFSFWDSLIIAAAEQASCAHLLSEDMQHGFQVNALRIWNPFI